DMQTDVLPHKTQAEPNEVTINEESTHDEKVGTPSVSGDYSDEEMVVDPDEEMTAKPSDPLRNELSDLYRTAENKENLPPVAATKATGVVDMQASMLSQVSNIKLDDFK
ncbi:15293_t:CDS:2, partial [Gigaspora margarita]